MSEIKLKRNTNIDIFRAFALLIVVVYHCWVKTGSFQISNTIVRTFICLGGEIGVTAFFLLSGYGIYWSLYKTESKEKIKFRSFITKRIKKIIPAYYLNLSLALGLTSSAVYLGVEHIPNILSHIFLVHNLFVNYHGAINGVLWTMGVIVQFYFFAIPLYKIINKIGFWAVPISTFVTILCKYSVYCYITSQYVESAYYTSYMFIYGRQLITALDNFVIGMGVAYIVLHYKGIQNKYIAFTGEVIGIIFLYVVCMYGLKNGIHINNISGYIWHSMVASCLGIIMFFLFYINIKDGIISKCLLKVSEYEYNIYLWHLLLINNLLQYSGQIQRMIEKKHYIFVWIIFISGSFFVGILFEKLIYRSDRKDVCRI